MFMTKVVIDTSNIVALVFYNKLEVNTRNPDGRTRPYQTNTQADNEKDIAGGMVNAFNPTSLISENFFTKAKQIPP